MNLEQKYQLVRSALVELVNSDDPTELKRIRTIMQGFTPEDDEQRKTKEIGIKAIDALLATQNTTEDIA